MKRRLSNLFIAFFCVLINATAGNSTDTLNVMTYNLRLGELASLEQLGGYIKSQNPDIVALQECDWKTKRKMAPKQNGKAFVNELAYFTGMFGLYGKTIDYGGGFEGIGLLSKYPITRSERILLPNPVPKKEQRALLLAVIEMPDKSSLTFISTHLEFSSAITRKAQIDFINELKKTIKTPVIIAGDFNATPDETAIKEGFSNWFNATDTTYTFSTLKPEIKIDYIFGAPKKDFKLVSTRVGTESKLSDHFPVCSKIILKKKKN